MFGRVKDPVCGMTVRKKTATATSKHMGKTFYFCGQSCKGKFDTNPKKYMGGMGQMNMGSKKGGCH